VQSVDFSFERFAHTCSSPLLATLAWFLPKESQSLEIEIPLVKTKQGLQAREGPGEPSATQRFKNLAIG